jgi:hypothetical protein
MWTWFKARWACRVVGHHETPVDCLGRIRCLRCGARRYHIPLTNGSLITSPWNLDDPPIRSHTTRELRSADQLVNVGLRIAEAGMPLAWLYAQHPQLDGLTPAEACAAGQVDQVFALIDQWIEYQEHHDV